MMSNILKFAHKYKLIALGQDAGDKIKNDTTLVVNLNVWGSQHGNPNVDILVNHGKFDEVKFNEKSDDPAIPDFRKQFEQRLLKVIGNDVECWVGIKTPLE